MSELVKQFKDLADSTLSMRELGRQTGLTATQISQLQYAAGKLHVDPAAVGGAISSWSSKMVEFRRHTGEFYTYLLRQNGDVAQKIAADNPVDAMKDTLDYLSRIPTAAMKAGASAADAAQIQKRVADAAGVGDLVPMLGKGPQGLAEAFADAAREVKPISAEMQAAADRFNEATNRFNQSWSNLKNDIGPAVIDPLTRTIDKLDEGLKFAAQFPGDAAAAAATIAGGLAAFWVRARIMRGSMISGGAGASGEMVGAAREQVKAGASLLEAAIALKEAAAELRGHGLPGSGAPGGAAPGEEPQKPTSGSFNNGRALLAAAGIVGVVVNAPGMDEAGDRERDANAAGLESFGEMARKALGVDWLQGKVDGWRKGGATAPSTGGARQLYSAPAIEEDQLTRARQIGGPSSDLKKDVQDGSKAGIIAGLREMAQQDELSGKGDPGHDGKGGVGAPSMRYGRNPASGGFRRGGHSGGGRGYADTPDGQGRAGDVKGGEAMRVMAAMNYLVDKKGWTPEGAAIAVGNAMQESQVSSRGGVGDPNVPGGSHKMFQWNNGKNNDTVNGRWARAQAHAKAQGKTMDDFEVNLDFMDEERKRRSGLEAQWHKQTDLHNAGRLGHLYEGYGDQSEGTRVQNARDALAAYKKAHPGAASPQAHASGGSIRGAGGPRSDSIPAWLSNGEFVVNAKASGQWLPFLHAINNGHAFADGGQVDAGLSRRRSWLTFFQRSAKDGGMGAPRHVAAGATAMMMGESGRALNPNLYGWDVNGPSGGTAQWHDVTKGKWAGKLHRLSDLMSFATAQHADWHDMGVQQAFWKREATGPLAGAWRAMRLARTAAGTLRRGINGFENPAQHDLEFARRLPNIVRLAREGVPGSDGRVTHQVDPVEVNIRHHPHTGHPIVTARAGKGVRIGIRTAPMMRPT